MSFEAPPSDIVTPGLRIADIPDKFGRDPARILAALAESQNRPREEEVVVILPIEEVRNLIFPPHEGAARWRLAYARAVISPHAARLTSPGYFSSSPEKLAELTSRPLVTSQLIPLREEVGRRAFNRLAPKMFQISDGVRTMMTLRSFAGRAFEQGDFQLRPIREWAQLMLETVAQFYPAALAETRLERHPWESVPVPENSFLAQVRDRVSQAGHDPAAALRAIFAAP